MKLSVKSILCGFVISFFSMQIVSGQEAVVGLQGNSILQKNICRNKNITSNDTLKLPFWDDFSDSNIYPKTQLWTDSFVYINNSYALNPPSVGVATFDLIDSHGNLYADADFNTTFEADRLTSRPIDLSAGSNIYLSFYYQPQGTADAPEPTDSLTVQFYSPLTKEWKSVWQAQGTTEKSFQFVAIPVSDSNYKKKGFQFRFINYGSLGSPVFPSTASDGDQWNIDFVYLNKNRNAKDSIFHDVSFTTPLHSFLNNYESMPWSHFLTNPAKFINTKFTVGIKNNDAIPRLLNSMKLSVTEIVSSEATTVIETGSQNLAKFNSVSVDKNVPIGFPDNSKDSARFSIQCQFTTDSYDSIQNNLISYDQVFKNYYAYDDGSAEAGYGLIGTGTKFGNTAYKFYPEKPDGVVGVEIYFNKTLNNASQIYFFLNLRKQINGFPDTAYISLTGVRPEYETELNQFYYYPFNDTVYVADTFYVGWTQTTEDMLNVGLDLNRQGNQNLYYNIGGGWKQSQVAGALMIRPVFCGKYVAPLPQKDKTMPVKLYPSPVKTRLMLDIPPQYMAQNIEINIYDMTGRLVYSENQYKGSSIDVSGYKPGIYILKIKTDENFTTEQKFAVVK
jgi:hypothetical protein